MSERIISCSAAIAEALTEEMTRDERIFIIGEDLVYHGGIFGQFKGLPERFPGRIIDTPISETCIVGSGLGAALTGMRPLVDLHFADFVTCAMDEIANQSAKIDSDLKEAVQFAEQSEWPKPEEAFEDLFINP